ncbi:hypothetical protein ACR34G_02545 [Mycoplasma sp. 480]|uniref:hypothetical protein n=1 Tax=Mycoplasma sp. 480 TaxID=3440155 RepID=UPI003F518E97
MKKKIKISKKKISLISVAALLTTSAILIPSILIPTLHKKDNMNNNTLETNENGSANNNTNTENKGNTVISENEQANMTSRNGHNNINTKGNQQDDKEISNSDNPDNSNVKNSKLSLSEFKTFINQFNNDWSNITKGKTDSKYQSIIDLKTKIDREIKDLEQKGEDFDYNDAKVKYEQELKSLPKKIYKIEDITVINIEKANLVQKTNSMFVLSLDVNVANLKTNENRDLFLLTNDEQVTTKIKKIDFNTWSKLEDQGTQKIEFVIDYEIPRTITLTNLKLGTQNNDLIINLPDSLNKSITFQSLESIAKNWQKEYEPQTNKYKFSFEIFNNLTLGNKANKVTFETSNGNIQADFVLEKVNNNTHKYTITVDGQGSGEEDYLVNKMKFGNQTLRTFVYNETTLAYIRDWYYIKKQPLRVINLALKPSDSNNSLLLSFFWETKDIQPKTNGEYKGVAKLEKISNGKVVKTETRTFNISSASDGAAFLLRNLDRNSTYRLVELRIDNHRQTLDKWQYGQSNEATTK